ncbi:WD40-repeat-containing domain protein [Melanogaster broomeanus]|nr:WD40-repeat-containing domain protein [Melanogaster broomeanus]
MVLDNDMLNPVDHEVIDVDNLDVLCTGLRRRIERPPSPRSPKQRNRKRPRTPDVVVLSDSDIEVASVASSSRTTLPPNNPLTRQRDNRTSRTWSPLSIMDQRTELQIITQEELGTRKKKRATEALVTALNMAGRLPMKRKERHTEAHAIPEVIELSSDSEPEVSSMKRRKVADPDEPHSDVLTDHSDGDDDDCTNLLSSLDISNEANWVPPASKKAEDLTPIHSPDLDSPKSQPLPPYPIPKPKPPVDYSSLPLDWYSLGQWGMIARNYGITRFPKRFYHARQENLFSCGPKRSPKLYYDRGYNKLALTAKYPHLASGSINRIIQAPGKVVLCAAVSAGSADYSDDDDDDQPPPPPENKAGSLVVYDRGRVHVPQAHCRIRMSSRGPALKYYSVNDVAFSPFNSAQFLSAGHDFIVRLWEIPDEDDDDGQGLHVIHDISFDDVVHDLVYTPDSSTLAITCLNGTVSLFDSHNLFENVMEAPNARAKFHVAPKGTHHATGNTVWGDGPSKHFLFTSSEPPHDGDIGKGYHRAFDVRKGVQIIEFDSTEAGDAAAVSPDGTTLVLFTTGVGDSHSIRLYDVRRRMKYAYETGALEKFRIRPSFGSNSELREAQEVNRVSFSSDGRLLAVPRSDNMLHIYDVRALSRGPLCRFVHHDSDTVGCVGYGVVEAKWIEGRTRIGIVSGGDDGCVRLWEPALGSQDEVQGAVIGRTDFDVGHFSVGDHQRGEKPLVIGDSGGAMHTYDFMNESGVPIWDPVDRGD